MRHTYISATPVSKGLRYGYQMTLESERMTNALLETQENIKPHKRKPACRITNQRMGIIAAQTLIKNLFDNMVG